MASEYSPDLRLELIGTGDQAGVWGQTTNSNLGTFIENAVAGYTTVTTIASPQALTANNGAADQARFAALALNTTTGAAYTVCIPPNSKLYTFYNANSSHAATISNSTVVNGTTLSGGATVVIPPSKIMSVWSDGTNVYQQNTAFITPALGTPASGVMTNVTGLPLTSAVTGTLPVANGGTGTTTSTGSGNVVLSTSPTLVTPVLGTPTSGNLSNRTSLSLTAGVSGTLPVANGGTGTTTSTGSGNVVLSTSPTLVTPILGTPQSGNFSTGTFTWPTFNQNTSGNAATVTNGVYTIGTQTIGGSKTFSSTILLADGGFMFSSDGGTDTGISWASDGVMNVRCNATTVGQFTSAGFTGNAATATTASSCSGNAATATTAGSATTAGTVTSAQGGNTVGSYTIAIDISNTGTHQLRAGSFSGADMGIWTGYVSTAYINSIGSSGNWVFNSNLSGTWSNMSFYGYPPSGNGRCWSLFIRIA